MSGLNMADCINETCPWSGKPVQADSLMEYCGEVVGFCNPGCRDKFERAIRHFKEAKEAGRADRSDNAPLRQMLQFFRSTGKHAVCRLSSVG